MASNPRHHPGAADVSSIYCHLDAIDETTVRGWAVDRAGTRGRGGSGSLAMFHVIVDGQELALVRSDKPRPDVLAAGLGPEETGFEFSLPRELADGQQHRLELRDARRRPVVVDLGGQRTPAIEFQVTLKPELLGFADGVREGAFEGWALRKAHSAAPMEAGVVVRITCDGATIGHARADCHRGDVARLLSAPPNCGFQFVPPQSVRRGYPREFRFFAMPENVELANSPQVTSVVVDGAEARLLALVDQVDALHRELTRIRRAVHDLVPKPPHTLGTYDGWYRRYAAALRARVLDAPPLARQPLVSVVCPVYRPNLRDFEAAVESVREQTYGNWELVLADDCSRDPALTALINRLVASDPRIRAAPRRRNGGISAATNTALAAAKGEWVAFLDHDDLLADVALSCMVEAAQAGGTVLYSDEDKVDARGAFSHPAFKPDWNHRLLLGVNYVCHLLMVRRDVLAQAGPLRTACDGAQDHDLILRLAELVPPGDVRHVPEVLYHWRMAPGSTASDTSAKAYAVAAGLKAVQDHLQRLDRPATVQPVRGMTHYDVRFQARTTPSVTVVIPYKDQIETTRRCVDALRGNTEYPNWDVVLVDNWSTSPESVAFAREVEQSNNMRRLVVEEPFNYSRINNLAVKESAADYIMFMNNDLFVQNKDWLSCIVGEAETDPAVGAVGGRFTYPNGTVQHAGVVLGLGGVAGHVHAGLPPGNDGYGSRAMFAQELSAVTGAGMLVRRRAFNEVGGFDEADLPVAFNDIDLCLKLRRAGHKVIYTPAFQAEHHESLSRGDDEQPAREARFFGEVEAMKARWGGALARDPFYSPHFRLDRQPFFDLVDPD